MGKPVTRASAFRAAIALVLSSCTCDSPEEPVNANGVTEGHMPPELPPMPTPKATSSERTPSADAGVPP